MECLRYSDSEGEELNSGNNSFQVNLWSSLVGVGDGQGGLACCNSWGYKQSDTTERSN